MIAFITEHKDHRVGDGLRWGVEPLCAVLSEHGIGISPSTYYEWVTRKPSARQLRDEQVTELIRAERASSKLVAGLGSRKMWLRLRGKGHDVARCTVERLYRANGWEGARYGKKPRTTIADKHAQRTLARRYQALDAEIGEHDTILDDLTRVHAPTLRAPLGIGADTAAEMLIVFGDNPDRIRSEPPSPSSAEPAPSRHPQA